MTRVLVVDDKQMVRDSVATTLVRAGLGAVAAPDGASAVEMIARCRPAAVVTDLKMPGLSGIELLQRIGRIDPDLPVILMTAYATVDTAVEAMRKGAFDYVQKPFEGDALVASVRRAVEQYRLRRENEALRSNAPTQDRLIGESEVMCRLRDQLQRIAVSEGTVLITGESGTGKEIIAHMIHQLSGRAEQVMLALNCAALSPNLLESELFGHEKGAFTGADQMRKGRFELAEGGTLLLDEVSEVGPPIQAKLLRVLQERQFERVGSSVTMDTDVRVIATTNRDLDRAVSDQSFRQDLYFRLNVLPVHLPPLRRRTSDIPLLAEHFLARQAARDGNRPRSFDADAMQLLMEYPWPGNVRELENVCERAGVLADGGAIAAALIRPWLKGPVSAEQPTIHIASSQTLEEMEREMIIQALGRYNGHRMRTAKSLGIGVRTLGLKLKKWKDQKLVPQSL